MKKTAIICIMFASYFMIYPSTPAQQINTSDNITSSYNLLVAKSAIFIKKNAIILSCTPLFFYYYKNILDLTCSHPYISSFCLYFMIHYLCDSILAYQQQKTLFDCIGFIKKITLDLVICHGIRNYAQQKKLALHLLIDDPTFFNTLTEDMHYSFHQIEIMTLKLYTKLKDRLNSLQHLITIESEEFVFLSHTSCIDIDTILYLTEHDPELHAMVINFEKNPQAELYPLLQFLKMQIHDNFNNIQQLLGTQDLTVLST